MNYNYSDGHLVINDTFVISDQTITESEHMILSKKIGPDMRYQQQGITNIDYPGEYELNGYTINVISDSEGVLNYVIIMGDDHIAFVQNPKLVTKSIFNDVTHRLCLNDDVITAIEKLDDTGTIINLLEQNDQTD